MLRTGGTTEHTQLQPQTALLALPMTGYTHWCLDSDLPCAHDRFLPLERVYLHFYKSTMKADGAPVMFDAAVQMSRTDVVQGSWGGGQDSVSGGSEEMGLLQQSPRTFHLPQDIMTP